jgi:hypothetical protein
MVDFAKLNEQNAKTREWQTTEIGTAFIRFENAMASYWQNDQSKIISERRLRELDNKMQETRKEFLLLLRGW